METAKPETPLEADKISRASVVGYATIPAGGMVAFSHYGERFYFVTATGPISVKTDASPEKPFRKGTGLTLPEGQRFKRLEVKNYTTIPVSIQLFMGFGEYVDTTQEIIESYTKLIGTGYTNVPAYTDPVTGGILVFPGTPSGDKIQRREILIFNDDLANNLYVLDENDNVSGIVFFKSSIAVPASGVVKVKNLTGLAIPCAISELWYTYTP